MNEQLQKLVKQADYDLQQQFAKIDLACMRNSEKVLNAFQKNKIAEVHFGSTTGYGYDDIGRDTIERVFADVLGGSNAIYFWNACHNSCVICHATSW